MRYKISTNSIYECTFCIYEYALFLSSDSSSDLLTVPVPSYKHTASFLCALHLSHTLDETAVFRIYETTVVSEKMPGRTIVHLYFLVCLRKYADFKTLLTVYVKSDLYIRFAALKQRNAITSIGKLSPTYSALKRRILFLRV
jgi:hypothetical protein